MDAFKVTKLFRIPDEQVTDWYKYTELVKSWYDQKKKDNLSEFELFGLENVLVQVLDLLKLQGIETVFCDNAFWFDANSSRYELCLTCNNIPMLVAHNDEGVVSLWRVEFGY